MKTFIVDPGYRVAEVRPALSTFLLRLGGWCIALGCIVRYGLDEGPRIAIEIGEHMRRMP